MLYFAQLNDIKTRELTAEGFRCVRKERLMPAKFYNTACLLMLLGLGSGIVFAQEQSAEKSVAYLLDQKGSIELVRSGQNVPLKTSCVSLFSDDSLKLGRDSSATVIFPSSAYVVSNAGTYFVKESEVLRTGDGKEDAIDPVVGFRGQRNALLQTDPPKLVMPPGQLFAAVKPPLMRAGSFLNVLSPRGSVLSTSPDIVWTGDKSKEYILNLVTLKGEAVQRTEKPVTVKGCQISWKDTKWPELRRDGVYRIEVFMDGNKVTGDDQNFSILDSIKAARINQELDLADKSLSSDSARCFVKANILARPYNACYSEARLMLVKLLKNDRTNETYLRMLLQCYAQLGLGEGFKAVQEQLDKKKLDSKE